jgi:hypothetical protein
MIITYMCQMFKMGADGTGQVVRAGQARFLSPRRGHILTTCEAVTYSATNALSVVASQLSTTIEVANKSVRRIKTSIGNQVSQVACKVTSIGNSKSLYVLRT